eukprot:1031684-Rhodomonas_salina.1
MHALEQSLSERTCASAALDACVHVELALTQRSTIQSDAGKELLRTDQVGRVEAFRRRASPHGNKRWAGRV